MIRIVQRTARDCTRCCIAMLMGMDYDDVPDFVEAHGEDWGTYFEEWLKQRGYGVIMAVPPLTFISAGIPLMAGTGGATGETGTVEKPGHMVVVTGADVIDPHEPPLINSAETVRFSYVYVIVKLP